MGNIVNFTATGPNYHSSFISAVRSEVINEGWDVFDLSTNDSYIVTFGNYQVGREFVARPPGNALQAGGGFVGLCTTSAYNPDTVLSFYAGTGYRELPAITSIVRNTGVLTFTFSAPHGLVAGSMLFHNGNSDDGHNLICGRDGVDFYRVQAAGLTATECTLVTPVGGSLGSAAGGNAIEVYNFTGNRNAEAIGPSTGRVRCANSAFTARFIVDKFRIAGVIEQAGVMIPFYAGIFGRAHISPRAYTVSKLTAPVVSDGITPSTLSVDRNLDNFGVGSLVQVIPQESLGPTAIIDNAQCEYLQAVVTAKPTAASMQAIIPAGTYPTGSVVGQDPLPITTFATYNLQDMSTFGAGSTTHKPNGTRVGASFSELLGTLSLIVEPTFRDEPCLDPNLSGETGSADLLFTAQSPINIDYIRKTARPFIACASGPNNYDILRLRGGTAVVDDWLSLTSLVANFPYGGWNIAIGPGAT